MKSTLEIFAARLKQLRSENNLSVAELSEITGISRSILYDYERGNVEPTMTKLLAIADYFNVDVGWLIGRQVPRRKPNGQP